MKITMNSTHYETPEPSGLLGPVSNDSAWAQALPSAPECHFPLFTSAVHSIRVPKQIFLQNNLLSGTNS